VGSKIAGAVLGFLSSNSRPYGDVDPAAAVSHDSSPVISVPHGVQNDGSNATWPPGSKLCQIVSVLPVKRS
jgi:hypothetical protein